MRPFSFDALHVDRADEAIRVNAKALADGQEGLAKKDPTCANAAGRRGRAWRKVKPVHTLDLVVLATEWGHSRRQGWLPHMHQVALDPSGGFAPCASPV